MSNSVLVSIVVAIYKSEAFLPKLLESIANQIYSNLEIILVNDGSPDNCGQICDEYVKKDSRFQVIHQKNSGTCGARNAGMDKATGDYLLIIDGDDWLESDYVQYLLELAISTKSDMSMTDKVFTTIDRKQTEKDSIEVWTSEKASAAIIYPEIPIGPWNKLYRLKVLNDNNLRFTTKWSGEGLYFSCMAAQYSNQVAVGHRKVYNYRLNNLNSGLTNYKLEIATNALENIKYIKNVSIIRTPYMIDAFDWHIWKNNFYVIYLIVATNSLDKERDLFNTCKKYIRKNLLRTVSKSKINKKEKIRMIIEALYPVFYSKCKLKEKQKRLLNDRME